jgi:predicted MFS family arabinose efflux permease
MGDAMTISITNAAEEPTAGLSRGTLLLMALACGVSVANVYFPQAITPLIAAHLHTTRASAALVATAAQLGYAAGLFLLVPLGDRLAHRRLIVVLLALTSAELLGAGSPPIWACLSRWERAWGSRRSCRSSCCRWRLGWSRSSGAAP